MQTESKTQNWKTLRSSFSKSSSDKNENVLDFIVSLQQKNIAKLLVVDVRFYLEAKVNS